MANRLTGSCSMCDSPTSIHGRVSLDLRCVATVHKPRRHLQVELRTCQPCTLLLAKTLRGAIHGRHWKDIA
jgi:hypothetical protein